MSKLDCDYSHDTRHFDHIRLMWCKDLHIFDLRMPYQGSILKIPYIEACRPERFQQNQANKNKSRLHYYLDIVSSGHKHSSDKHQRVHFEWLKRYLRNSKSMHASKDRMNNRSVTKKTEKTYYFQGSTNNIDTNHRCSPRDKHTLANGLQFDSQHFVHTCRDMDQRIYSECTHDLMNNHCSGCIEVCNIPVDLRNNQEDTGMNQFHFVQCKLHSIRRDLDYKGQFDH